MQLFTVVTSFIFALLGVVAADPEGHVKVFLFAHPAFISEVQIDALNSTCFSLRNNLYGFAYPRHWPNIKLMRNRRIDGKVQSLLVGGHDVASVIARKDYWWCMFYEYVSGDSDEPAMRCAD